MIVSSYFKLGKSLLHDHNYMIHWSYFWSKNYHMRKNPVPLSVRYPWSYIHDSFYLQTRRHRPWSILAAFATTLDGAQLQKTSKVTHWMQANKRMSEALDILGSLSRNFRKMHKSHSKDIIKWMIGMVKSEFARVTFQVTNKNEVNARYIIIKSVDYIKWFP